MKILQIIKIEKNKAYQDKNARPNYVACEKIIKNLINYLKTGNISSLNEIKKQKENLVNIVTSCIESSAELKSKYGNNAQNFTKKANKINNVTDLVNLLMAVFDDIANDKKASTTNGIKNAVGKASSEFDTESSSDEDGPEGKIAMETVEKAVDTILGNKQECETAFNNAKKAMKESKETERSLANLLEKVKSKNKNNVENVKNKVESKLLSVKEIKKAVEETLKDIGKLKDGKSVVKSESGKEETVVEIGTIADIVKDANQKSNGVEQILKDAQKMSGPINNITPDIEQTLENAKNALEDVRLASETAIKNRQKVETNAENIRQILKKVTDNINKAEKAEKKGVSSARIDISGGISEEARKAEQAAVDVGEILENAKQAVENAKQAVENAEEYVKQIQKIVEDVKQSVTDTTDCVKQIQKIVANIKEETKNAQEIYSKVVKENIAKANSIDDISAGCFSTVKNKNYTVRYLTTHGITINVFRETLKLLGISPDKYLESIMKMDKLGVGIDDLKESGFEELGYKNASEFIKALETIQGNDKINSLKDAIKFGFKDNLAAYNQLISYTKRPNPVFKSISDLIDKFKQEYKEKYEKDHGEKFIGEVPEKEIPKGKALTDFADELIKPKKASGAQKDEEAPAEYVGDGLDQLRNAMKKRREAEEFDEYEDSGEWSD